MIELPATFAAGIRSRLGEKEGAALLAALDGEPVTSVRLNPAKRATLMPDAKRVEWAPEGFILPQRPVFTLDPQWHQGRFYVQETASMFVGRVAAMAAEELGQEALKVLDLCAAPGGKTTAVADVLPQGSLMIANEYVPKRADILQENLMKWGTPNTIVTRGETKTLCQSAEGWMDMVIADVPCSGEGMMRKEEEARRQWTPGLVESCATLQREIVANGATALRQGGMMIYSTCTFNAEENERNVEWICANLGFEVVDISAITPSQARSHGAGIHFYPHLSGSEGLYVCLLRKTGAERRFRLPKVKSKEVNLPEWFAGPEQALTERNGVIYALSREYLPIAEAVKRQTMSAGTPVATPGKRSWEPTHELAMSRLLRREAFATVEFDREEALKYLSLQTGSLPPTFAKGHLLVMYHNEPLGWIKNLGNRYNNLYPRHLRIRMNIT